MSVSWEITVERRDGTRLRRHETHRSAPLKAQKITVKDDHGKTILAEIIQYKAGSPRGTGPAPYQVTVREVTD